MEIAEIVMNPVRQRIIQYFLIHETGTVKEVRKALPDIPKCKPVSPYEDPDGQFHDYRGGGKSDSRNGGKHLSAE